MAENPIKAPLPADLPEDWTYGQTVAPTGEEAGLSTQHGYNYLMQQVNAAQRGVNEVGKAFSGLPSLGPDGKIPAEQLPTMDYVPNSQKGTAGGVATLGAEGKLVQDVDGGTWDTDPVEAHNGAAPAHANLRVDGNTTAAADASATLEEHMANPMAHQNLVIDGNAGR